MRGRIDQATDTRPSWWRLYSVATVMLALIGVVETYVPDGIWRRTLEVMIAGAAFAVMHLWVRANRRALDMVGERNAGFRRVVEIPPALEVPDRWTERAAKQVVLSRAAGSGRVVSLPRRGPSRS
jgi:hypothetical protein